jgi:hypothetical protein
MATRDSQVYDALKGRKSRYRTQGEKPLLAAAFGNCSDHMSYLCGASLNLSGVDVQDEIEFADQVLAALKTWGDETGACTQALDHRLRLSRDLKTRTLALLQELDQDIETCELFLPFGLLLRQLTTSVQVLSSYRLSHLTMETLSHLSETWPWLMKSRVPKTPLNKTT